MNLLNKHVESGGGGRRGRVVVGFIATYAIIAYQHKRYEFESRAAQFCQ